MKPGTVFCLVLVKWFELVFLTLITAFMFVGLVQMNHKLEGEAQYLVVLGIIACVFAGMNLFYNNLLLNLRYKFKADCYTFGHLVYDIPNHLCLHTCCHWLCRDRWCVNLGTPIKWLVKFIYFIVTISIIKDYKREHPELNEFNPDKEDVNIIFDDLLIVYLFQHVIFIALRPIFLMIFLCTTCCYDHGKANEKGDPLNDAIISYDYIAYTKLRFNSFKERAMGGDELRKDTEFTEIKNAALEETRRHLNVTDGPVDKVMSKIDTYNHPGQLVNGMRDGLVDLTGYDESNHECMICVKKFVTGQQIIRLGCSIYHVYHVGCFKNYKEFYVNAKKDIKCPTCSFDFYPDNVTRHTVLAKAGSPEKKNKVKSTVIQPAIQPANNRPPSTSPA